MGLRLFTAFAPLLLTLLAGGCAPRPASPPSAPPPASNVWVTSDDGLLALRLSVLTPRVKANEDIQVVAALRNVSERKLTVLRPFGDHYDARAVRMKVWDGARQLRYTGPALSYVIGSGGFAVLGPGEVVEDKMEVTGNFPGIERPGRYTLRYDYSYDGCWDHTAAANNSGISNAWRGTISSREVEVFRK